MNSRFLALFFLLFSSFLYGAPLKVDISSESGILINGKTGAVLFEKAANEIRYPASITKTAVGLYVVKKASHRLDEIMTAKPEALASISWQAKVQSNFRSPAYWLEGGGTHIGIKNGEQLSLRQLLYAMLISSANDASNVIAYHLGGGSIPHFMDELNTFLKEIGCKKTHFLNPHGLHHPQHVTTAYDMALVAKEAMKDPLFREVVSTVRYTIPQTNLEEERHLVQTNLLMRSGAYFYTKAIGVKTGSTQAAGRNLIAAAEDSERLLISVVLKNASNKDRYDNTIRLFEAAFNQPKKRKLLLPKGRQAMKLAVKGGKSPLLTFLPKGLSYDFYPAEEPSVKAFIKWDPPTLPIEKGQVVGVVRALDQNGTVLREEKLLAEQRVEPTFFHRCVLFFGKNKQVMVQGSFIVGGAALASVTLTRKKGRRKKRPSRFF